MRHRKECELDEEIRGHFEMAVRERIERGESRADAEAAARREFGNVALVKEVTREMWGWSWVERLLQDVRYAGRLLRRSPGFTAVALASLTLGIGANTAIFQVINSVRLRPLPVHEPARLTNIRIADMTGARGYFDSRYPAVTYAIWERVRDGQQAFSGVLAWNGTTFSTAANGDVRRIRGLWVSGSFFAVLGVPPAEGRVLTAGDDAPGCAPRAVVSHAFWQHELGGRPIAGTTLSLDGQLVEIVGVSARGFTGVEVGRTFQVALPLCAEPAVSGGPGRLAAHTTWWLALMGRLRPGATIEQASAQLASLSPAVFQATLPPGYPAGNVNDYLGFRLEAVRGGAGVSGLREDFSTPLTLLLIAAGVVLVIACVNIANLLLARASAREREFAVRLGLGATRGRVIRQLLVESLLLAAIGGIFGSFLASVLGQSLLALLDPGGQTISLDLATDWRVLAFTIAAAAATCVLFGLVPALRGTRVSVEAVLRGASRGATGGRDRGRLRRTLVALQVALSVFLLSGALLFARTLANLLAVDPGFSPEGVIVAAVDLRPLRIPADALRARRAEVLGRVRAIAGVESAAALSVVPLSGSSWGNNFRVEGVYAATPIALVNRVSEGYFATMRIPLVAGRDFSAADTTGSRAVAIVNRTFVERTLDGASPLGRRLIREAVPDQPETSYEIVGVVEDSKYLDLRQEPRPGVFFADSQASRYPQAMQLVLRSALPPATLRTALATAMRDLGAPAAISVSALKTDIRDTLAREQLIATLSGFFAALAAALAVVGLYGVLAYAVTSRTKEIGVRMALGARGSDVLRLVLSEAVVLIAIGVAAGLGAAVASGRATGALLFGLTPTDPLTLAAAAGSLAAVALAASCLPARAATRIAPMTALRID